MAIARRRTILITGSGSGIGRDCAMALARRAHNVLASTHTESQAEHLREQAAVEGLPIEAFKLDITDEADLAKAEETSIDVLINNAAIGESGSLAEVPLDRVRSAFETNVFATLALNQLCLRGMIARRHGTVIFISSLAGRVAAPFLLPYAMTKFSLSAAADGLRQELKQLDRNIHVSVVEPGAFHTGFNQRMIARKYEWMRQGSYFEDQLDTLKAREQRMFDLLELSSTAPIVRKIIQAAEADRPRFRYSAPWWQSTGVQLLRIFGK
jgi:short-subunit dehydrogenase